MDLPSLSKRLIQTIQSKVSAQSLAWMFLKLVFIVGASCLAAIAQFADVDRFSDLSQWQVIGISAAIAAGLGGVVVTLRERDATEELSLAQTGLEAARSLKLELSSALNEFEGQSAHLERVVSLYLSIRSMRSVLETAQGLALSDVSLVKNILSAAKRSLLIALDFRMKEHWTIAVYRAEKDQSQDRRFLRCIATERSVPCDINQARLWPEGSVPAGVSLAVEKEIAIPDTESADMSSMMDLGSLSKASDRALYRSMFVAPILVHGSDRAWGVVMATSSRPYHFDCGGPEGVRTAEAVRCLADMVALGLAVHAPPLHVGTL